MSMTMTQKILAAHAGLDRVKAGQLIEAKLDVVMGNDITVALAQPVLARSDNVQPLIRRLTALFRHRYLQLSGKVLSGDGILAFQQPADFAANCLEYLWKK